MIFYILAWLISIGLAVTGSLTFWKINEWYDFYRPIVLFFAGFLGFIVILWIIEDVGGRITSSKKKTYEKPSKFNRFLLNEGMDFITRLCLARCEVIGKNKVPHNKTYLLVCNHKSNFDNFFISNRICRQDHLAFVSKPSNFKVPLGGRHMHRQCYLPIEKDDKIQSLEVMKTCIDKISKGYTSYGIFPEGQRAKTESLLPFHEGIFNVAIHAKCPIVICAIKNTEKIAKRFPLSTKVKLKVVGVLEYEEIQGQTAKAVSDTVKGIIENALETL
ncbi:MAG: 1-acyl-sn-glycerol-3-phosphate acyltransferase [Bacilli bacterium]|nr:1-acyl-sn-glycerol-3-phosphate acyltransferase [Bacilli bacterium]